MTICPHCNQHILNVYEQKALKLAIKLKDFKSKTFSKQFKVTHSQANNILKKLVDNGLIRREQLMQKSGGVEYNYTTRKLKAKSGEYGFYPNPNN